LRYFITIKRNFLSLKNYTMTLNCYRRCRIPSARSRRQQNFPDKEVKAILQIRRISSQCCSLLVGVVLNARFTTNGMCAKNNTYIDVAWTSNKYSDCGVWSLLLLAATVWSFAHMPLELSDRNNSNPDAQTAKEGVLMEPSAGQEQYTK